MRDNVRLIVMRKANPGKQYYAIFNKKYGL
jgi:hypothetical protein